VVGLRLGDVAQALGITAQTAGTSIEALLAKGLVRKTGDKADKRAIALHLTAAGQHAAENAADWPSAMLTAIGALAEAEQGALLVLIVKMIRALQIKGEIEAQRMCLTCAHFRPFAHDDPDNPHHCAFVDAAFKPAGLRIDCKDHAPAPAVLAQSLWSDFLAGTQPP
jgi:DNA-binding MarR family transcriptional regulator